MQDESLLSEAAHKRIHRRFKRRTDFAEHVALFAILTFVPWTLWLFTASDARMSAVILLIFTAIVLVAGLSEFFKFLFGELEDRAIQREIEQEREWRLQMRTADKNKNDELRLVNIPDDGELVDIETYDAAQQEDRAQARRL